MSRNLKALGLALAAVFAMSAVVASAAQAETDVLKTFPTTEHVILTSHATSGQIFTVGGLEVSCSEVTLDEATNTDGTSEITVKPTYNHEENTCKSLLNTNLQATTNGCHYTFHGKTNAEGHAEVDLTCPEGKAIVLMAAFECTITIPPQTLSGIHYTNLTTEPELEDETKMDVTLEATVEEEITYETEHCGIVGIADGHHEGASYHGTVEVTADADIGGEPGEAVGITVETT